MPAKITVVWSDWWMIAASILCSLAVIWLLLAVTLWLARPDELSIREFIRLLPDLLRLLKRLAVDRQMPRRIRVALFLLLAFIASPIDLIPDVIPVIGFADDVIITGLVLRWITRTAGPDALVEHWPGTSEGLAAVRQLCGLCDPRV